MKLKKIKTKDFYKLCEEAFIDADSKLLMTEINFPDHKNEYITQADVDMFEWAYTNICTKKRQLEYEWQQKAFYEFLTTHVYDSNKKS